MSDVKVTIRKNGPYLVQGPVELRDAEGNPVAASGSTIALCRCGGSMNKPFCDGTHGKIGFQGTLASEASGSCCQGEHKHGMQAMEAPMASSCCSIEHEAKVMEPTMGSSCCQGEHHHEKLEPVEMSEGASCCSADKHHHC